jgi:hypothetical protein
MVAVTEPAAPPATDTVVGLKVQEEFAGAPEQVKVSVPAEAPTGVTVIW